MAAGVNERIKPRERDAVIQALRAGVVPRIGIQHVQVGREGEVKQVVADMGRVAEGGCAMRFVVGDYGSGKTFFLSLARSIAMQKSLVVVNADLAPDRRLYSGGGQARNLYAELMRNMATRSKPEGGALSNVVERFVGEASDAAKSAERDVGAVIQERLRPLQDLVSGFDFATVVERYWRAFEEGDEQGKAAALRWLRGEHTLKTEAREALGVRSIIDDANAYDYLKVMGRFATLAGYGGLFVILDEMVNLFKLANAGARNSNYEQVLRIVNDVLQGSAAGLGVYFGGTPEFLTDTRRGLYSYEALRSRLAENSFARDGLVDLSGPVVRLQSLTREELYVLLGRLRRVFSGGDPKRELVPDEALHAFLAHCERRVGDAYFRTPRNTIKAFLDLLAVLDQNPEADWRALLGALDVAPDKAPSGGDIVDEPSEPEAGRAHLRRPVESVTDDEDLTAFRV